MNRLMSYLAGGQPPGASRSNPGCRDSRPPALSVPVELTGALYFATESPVWSGGRAFYDPHATGHVYARAHLVTAEQFSDIAAQEMYREPGTDLDLTEVLRSGVATLGHGRYETLVCPDRSTASPAHLHSPLDGRRSRMDTALRRLPAAPGPWTPGGRSLGHARHLRLPASLPRRRRTLEHTPDRRPADPMSHNSPAARAGWDDRQARQRSIVSGGLPARSAQNSSPNSATPAAETVSGTQVNSAKPAACREFS